jgi:hypothetical protein
MHPFLGKEFVAAHEFDLPYRHRPKCVRQKGETSSIKLVVTGLSNWFTTTDDVDGSVEAILRAVRLMG